VARGSSPTIRRRELGALLRKLRLDRDMTGEDATAALLFSPTKLSRIENGQSGASPRDIRDMCNLYEVTDPGQRELLELLAREGKQRGWWQDFDLPYATYVGLEAEAAAISTYNSGAIHGLLQTEGYARAMLRTEAPPLAAKEIQQRVEARLTRQTNLLRADGPAFHAVIDEAAIRRMVGGPDVMQAQLERIGVVMQLPNVTVQVIPFKAGAHPAMESIFTVLSFEQATVQDLVYVEGLVGNIYLERPSDLHRYRTIFERLCGIALDAGQTQSLLESIATGN
jgi:transcriptional regulator with XRE-family HTH domain